jgi:secreted trypsin-like serine protease
MRRLVVVVSLVVGSVVAAAAPASAITYGTGHPNVGALIAEWRTPGQKDQLCSGTLISPTVFLTAAHCTAFLESIEITQVWVTFDAEFTASSALISGTMHTNPGFNQSQSDPGDIAVIVLSRPAAEVYTGIAPASLPSSGLFDQLGPGGLRGQTFTAVGYGVHQPAAGGGPPEFSSLDVREVATSTFRALNAAWLRLSQNNATGDGGTCYGDSGGPNFLGTSTMVAAITVTGDAMCLATNVVYRLDTSTARDFLDEFVTLP